MEMHWWLGCRTGLFLTADFGFGYLFSLPNVSHIYGKKYVSLVLEQINARFYND